MASHGTKPSDANVPLVFPKPVSKVGDTPYAKVDSRLDAFSNRPTTSTMSRTRPPVTCSAEAASVRVGSKVSSSGIYTGSGTCGSTIGSSGRLETSLMTGVMLIAGVIVILNLVICIIITWNRRPSKEKGLLFKRPCLPNPDYTLWQTKLQQGAQTLTLWTLFAQSVLDECYGQEWPEIVLQVPDACPICPMYWPEKTEFGHTFY
ncbi:hypothetical protein TNCV_1905081 [Trichonephila clavipes]|nr:hypothetical protein TNCV_1905081 [Trichonephila clavipes]